jgi:Ion channel
MDESPRERARRAEALRGHLFERRASRHYVLVLALVVSAVLFMSFAPEGAWARGVLLLLESITLAAALWRSRSVGSDARIGFVLAAMAIAVLQVVVGGTALTALASGLNAVFAISTIVVIARGVVTGDGVTFQSVIAAICIYLLVGITFTFLYGAAAAIGNGPFFTEGTDGTISIRLYFSFITLTTVGYGDYAAAGSVGHTLSFTEALMGQLYLVTVVALLVGRLAPARS